MQVYQSYKGVNYTYTELQAYMLKKGVGFILTDNGQLIARLDMLTS